MHPRYKNENIILLGVFDSVKYSSLSYEIIRPEFRIISFQYYYLNIKMSQ